MKHHEAPGATEGLAWFILETDAGTIPQEAFENAEKCIADTVACILSGSSSELMEPLAGYLASGERYGTRPVIGTDLRAAPQHAALVNAGLGHALDFDDVLSMMPAHPSTVILPALFARLPAGTSGRKLLEAYVLGVEAGAKIGLAISNAHYRQGWHATGTLAIFSAVAALGRLLAIDREQFQTAIGIAASMSSGLRCNFGTMMKPMHAAWASHNAVVAVDLALAGITAATDALEAEAGFFSTYGTEQSDLGRLLPALGNPYALIDPGLALKKYPCCYALHRPIDALLMLRDRMALNAGNVEQAICRVAPGALRPLIYDRPRNGLEAKFSLEYTMAAALLDGRLDLAAYSDAGAQRSEIAGLIGKMHKIEDPRCLDGDTEPQTRSAGTIGFVEVTVHKKDGTSDTQRIDKPVGSPQHPLGWDDLEAKFSDCANQAGFSETAGRRAWETWRSIGDAVDVETCVELLTRRDN